MTGRLLIYGAAGFTGRLIVQEALARGLPVVLGGRTRASLEALAATEALEYRLAALEDPAALRSLLGGVAVLVNAAGPFRHTALALANACIERGVHYLDISGELDAIESLVALNESARNREVMLLPGAGFDVVASDCLAALVARQLPSISTLEIALRGLNAISRGSARSVFDHLGEGVLVRRNGRISLLPGAVPTESFDFGNGLVAATPVSWADVSTAYYTTGAPNITVYYEATPLVRLGLTMNRYGSWLFQTPAWRLWRGASEQLLPDGPGHAERARARADVVVRATDIHGRGAEGRLHTPEVYSFTASTVADIVDRVLSGQHRAGFQTPANVFGADYVLSLPGVTYEPAATSGHFARHRSATAAQR
jgi:short subunit dehydrogenase-like uncharacterized protein